MTVNIYLKISHSTNLLTRNQNPEEKFLRKSQQHSFAKELKKGKLIFLSCFREEFFQPKAKIFSTSIKWSE